MLFSCNTKRKKKTLQILEISFEFLVGESVLLKSINFHAKAFKNDIDGAFTQCNTKHIL